MTDIQPDLDWRKDYRQAQFDEQSLWRLHTILSYWKQRQYQYVALPWMAPEIVMAHTRPDNAATPEPRTNEGALVASGEQSFLWLDDQEQLDPTAAGFVGWTPCFRHEHAYDERHHHYFMKAELFVPVYDDPRGCLDTLIANVTNSWRALAISEGRRDVLPECLTTGPDSMDLLVNGVELGSFGIRQRLSGRGLYLYGTALAEPRWSLAWPWEQRPRASGKGESSTSSSRD